MSNRQKRKDRVHALWARRRREIAGLLQARTGDYGHAIILDYAKNDGELARRSVRLVSPPVRKIQPKAAVAQIERTIDIYERTILSGFKRVRYEP